METEVRKYNIIYADPPWQYKGWTKKPQFRTAASHYKTQDVEYLKSLNVPAICSVDAVLLMWATFPLLQEALELGKAWGFTYKTVAFTWVKQTKTSRLFVGMGYYTRANAEIVLLFTKGTPLKRVAKNVQQVVISKIGRHSQKPVEVRNRIVQLFGDLPRIELFARNRPGFFPDYEYSGWDVFGNEVLHSVSFLDSS